jgi:hypothetical protein
MTKIQKPIVVLLFALLAMIGCKRESLPDKPDSPNEEGKTAPSSNEVIYRKSAAEIAAAKEKWLTGALASMRGEIAARGGCGAKFKNHLELVEVTGTCGGTWNVKYDIWSLDWVGSGYELPPVTVSFTDVFSGSLSYNLISSSATQVDPTCVAWYADGYCLLQRDYRYQLNNVTSSSTPWPADIGNYALGLRSGYSGTCTPLSITGDLKGSLTAAEIEAMEALITLPVGPVPNLLISTQCASLCYTPNVICPTSGDFRYRIQGSGASWTHYALNAAGGLIFGLASGTYEYECELTYTISGSPVTSLTKTGTFTIM